MKKLFSIIAMFLVFTFLSGEVMAEYDHKPVANAGKNKVVEVNKEFYLDGSGTTDKDRDIKKYKWSGDGVNFTNANSRKTDATVAAPGKYTITLTVTDKTGKKDTDEVIITAKNKPPIANAGEDLIGKKANDPFYLNGSKSSDPNGGTLAYEWSAGSNKVTFADATKAKTKVTISVPGVYANITLTVTDQQGKKDTDTVSVTVNNQLPTVSAGENQTVNVGQEVNLTGTGTDPDNGTVNFKWSTASKDVVLENANSANANITLNKKGSVEVTLKVIDQQKGSSTDTVTITARNQAPIASAGTDVFTEVGQEVNLSCADSVDPDGDVFNCAWKASTEADYTPTLTNSDKAATFNSIKKGIYTVTLTVTDSEGATARDEVKVMVNGRSLIANAGPDLVAEIGQTINLPSTGSSNPDGGIISIGRSITAPAYTTAATLTSNSSEIATFTASAVGVYTVHMCVFNDSGVSSCDDVNINVITTPSFSISSEIVNGLVGDPIKLQIFIIDAQGGDITVNWTLSKAPDESTATLDNTFKDQLMRNLTTNLPGKYEITVNVTTTRGGVATTATTTITEEVIAVGGEDPIFSGFLEQQGQVRQEKSISLWTYSPKGRVITDVCTGVKPDGNTAVVLTHDVAGRKFSFTTDVIGVYSFSCYGEDSVGVRSRIHTLTFEALNIDQNSNPVFGANPCQERYVGEECSFNLWSWSYGGYYLSDVCNINDGGTPSASATTIVAKNGRTFSFTPDMAGKYTFTCASTDSQNKASSKVFDFYATERYDNPPTMSSGKFIGLPIAKVSGEVYSWDLDGDPIVLNATWKSVPKGVVVKPELTVESIDENGAKKLKLGFTPQANVSGDYVVTATATSKGKITTKNVVYSIK